MFWRTCIPKGWFIHPLICRAASRFPNPLLIAGQFLQFFLLNCKDISVKCSSTRMISNYEMQFQLTVLVLKDQSDMFGVSSVSWSKWAWM